MNIDAIRSVANAILYEGYMLYPYRPSALKNRSQGWTFGTLLPEPYAATHPGESCAFEAQLLVIGSAPQLSIETRFLQLCGADAVERTVSIEQISISQLLLAAAVEDFALPQLPGDQQRTLQGTVRVSAEAMGEAAAKITISVQNHSSQAASWDTRDAALQEALVSCHALIALSGGDFVSLLNPPDAYRGAVEQCKQIGVFPVLAGDHGDRNAMLISPIILYDYPQIAPSSHGEFFDSSEIDEMLTLRVLTLTEEEKEEVRRSNPRARDLLQRTMSLSPEEILSLHGVLRDWSVPEE